MSVLAGVAAFKGIDPADLARVEAKSRVIEPRDGAPIFAQGDAADAVYAIIAGEGHVRIGAMSRSSKGLMIEVFNLGEIFGEIGVLDGSARTADAVAVGRLRLLRIDSHTFLEALNHHAVLGANLCRLLADRLRRTFDLLQDATFESLEVRLARQVLYLVAARQPTHRAGSATLGPVQAKRSGRSARCHNPQHHNHPECLASLRPGRL